jgi:uncharacterized protein (DUF433 family)
MEDVQLSDEFPLIVANPGRLGGKPCIKDTRISVSHILELLASGGTVERILEGWPALTPEAIEQAALFAARQLEAPAVRVKTTA